VKQENFAPGTRAVAQEFPRGVALLRDPAFNKGTAFTEKERDALGLRGLLPPHPNSQDEQVQRSLENLRRLPDDFEKHIALMAVRDRNETLFYRILTEYPEETMPIVYTPTVGLACQRLGHIFQRPRGIFIGANDRGRIAGILRNWPYREVAMIVVTDGERILGLGDLGANGMGIPVGKLALYTACAGVHPMQCLPVMLDMGTENEASLADPFYIGLRRRRLRGQPYDELLEEFIMATQEVFPGAMIQFEDFATRHAFQLLKKYRDRICAFNDDIQGTGAVALAGLCSALRITGGKLTGQKILCLGAGEAAAGICDLVVPAMAAAGITEAEARSRCWLFNSKGLVVSGRNDLAEHHLPYAQDHAHLTDFVAAVEALEPTAIIGVSGRPHTFSKPVLEAMARINERPIVFALSNPTSQSECTAEEAYALTQGRAVFACGSPFDPVTINGKKFVPRQGNNAYIFPGVGLGVIACGARKVTDEMFFEAANALASLVTQADLEQGSIYPALTRIREVSAHIAAAVAKVAYRRGLATQAEPADMLAYVRSQMYEPRYRSYL